MSTISEWDSHDQMHAASEKYGDPVQPGGRDRRSGGDDPHLAEEGKRVDPVRRVERMSALVRLASVLQSSRRPG